MIEPKSHIAAIAPYALAPPPDADQTVLAGLDKNESYFPPSPSAIAAATEVAAHGHLYPDPDATVLRTAIAAAHGLPVERILCGSGSMELISALVHSYAGPGDRVLSTQWGYAFFRTATQLHGATYDVADERDFSVDVDTVLSAVRPQTRIVFIANPGNPTGTHLPSSELVRLRKGLPADCLLVIDEAYGEFAQDTSLENSILTQRDDTVILRTFSKAYALAGFRVGWGVVPQAICAELRKTINPSNLSLPAQVAATAAIKDHPHMEMICRETSRRRSDFSERLAARGIATPESQTNFVLADLGDTRRCEQTNEKLRNAGLFCRPMGGYGLPSHLRITIGDESAMRKVASILEHNHLEESPE